MASSTIINIPTDDKVFESNCIPLFAGLLNDPNVKLFGTRGKKQFGLDLIGKRERDPNQPVGIQCKLITRGAKLHDVFHFAYSAILHWSPVMRALIKHKRKSKPDYDEAQDSGRAIVVEEGLTAWIFTRAKELNFFEGQDRVSLGMLKTIGEFVVGYEVSQCPLKLWERATLEGYEVFRQIRAAEGG